MINKQFKIISVDFQKDFTEENGFAYKIRPSVGFVKEIFVPFLQKNNIKIAEIISDYRKIPLSSRGFFCQPGEAGFESAIPNEVKEDSIWVKCAHSPIWIRKNIGIAEEEPGAPYQNPESFTRWLNAIIGEPNETKEIILIGLTANCCVLCLAQELFARGYSVKILKEAVDDYSGEMQAKENSLNIIKGNRWADIILWDELKNNPCI